MLLGNNNDRRQPPAPVVWVLKIITTLIFVAICAGIGAGAATLSPYLGDHRTRNHRMDIVEKDTTGKMKSRALIGTGIGGAVGLSLAGVMFTRNARRSGRWRNR